MTFQAVTLTLSEELAEQAREVTRQLAYQLLSNTPNIDIDSVKWDVNYQQHGIDGPQEATEIAGCVAEARLTIRWERSASEPKRIYHAAEAIADLDFSPTWLRAILAYEAPPLSPTTKEDVDRLRWGVTSNGNPEYDAADELLTFRVKLEGMK